MKKIKHPAGHVLQAFHDGELDPAEASEVKAHCETCESCRAEVADLEEMGNLLSGVEVPELPRTVWHRVRPGRERESRLKPVFAAAACAAGIALGVLLGPIDFSAGQTGTTVAWSETVAIWDGGASSPLLGVFQSASE